MFLKKLQQVKELLRLHYGFNEFRSGQKEAIESILNKKDTLVIMPTGGGKSLIYQLSALVLEGVTIVVSPLIALMKDQVDTLNSVGIPATFINSSISFKEVQERIERVQSGFYKILYVAPERFNSQDFLSVLKNVKVDLFAVDEAHCISEWGHDFRPSYTRLNKVVEFLNNPMVVALTATATPEVKEDIGKQLKLKSPKIIVTGFKRPNLQLGVLRGNDYQKLQAVLNTIKSMPESRGIVYVNTRAKADEIMQALLNEDFKAASYHAGMDQEDRKWVQDSFMKDKVEIVVATNAFGLGIDKKNIRFVIHYNMPGTVEAYYQEAGRAGRDGKSSFCLLLFSPRDRYLQEFFIQGDNPEGETILEIYELLLNYDDDRIMFTYSEICQSLNGNVPEMAVGAALKILESNGLIRRSHEKAGNAYFKILTDFNKALGKLGPKAKKQRNTFEAFYRKYEEELKKGGYFNLEEVSELVGVKRETLKRMSKSLADKGVLEYKPPFRGTEIKVLKRVERDELELDFKVLREKADKAYKKLNKIENYVYYSGCRQEYILNYFGDIDSQVCGKCDNCLTTSDVRIYEEEPKRKKKTGIKLNTKLTQLETYELYNKDMSISEIAKKREIKENTVFEHLSYLVEKGLITNIDNFVDKKNQAEIKKAIKKIDSDKLKPVFEELKEKISYNDIKMVIAKEKNNNKKNG
ncbi:RecQ family ATP-dependent DNA helicase [bacterium]|nr:RecQ family ATP-dependent DNA helicase [bacterium]